MRKNNFFSMYLIDEIIRAIGKERNKSQMRIIFTFLLDEEQIPDLTYFVKTEFGEGGLGIVLGAKMCSVWYDQSGMRVAIGESALSDYELITWDEIRMRIQSMLFDGTYAPQEVLDAARKNVIREIAEELISVERDLKKDFSNIFFADTNIFFGTFPDVQKRISELLEQPDFLLDLIDRMEKLAAVYATDKSIMRFPHHDLNTLVDNLRRLTYTPMSFKQNPDYRFKEHILFISQDEIDDFLVNHCSSDHRLSIFTLYEQNKNKKEIEQDIKEMYGTGGCSDSLLGADYSWANYDGKGLMLKKGLTETTASVLLKWNMVEKRIRFLIQHGRYLLSSDYERMKSYESRKMANKIILFYYHFPLEIKRPYKDDFFHEHARKELPVILVDHEKSKKLIKKMEGDLSLLPSDFEDYEEKKSILSLIKQYTEGSYTLFPSQQKTDEDTLSKNVGLFSISEKEEFQDFEQITIFDFL